MNKRNSTILFRISSFLGGAVLNYLYLLTTGKVGGDNLGLLVFFSMSFMVFATELVDHCKLFDMDIEKFSIYFGAERTPQTEVEGPQTIYLFLFLCAAIVAFQTM